jgi:hypothetical protein
MNFDDTARYFGPSRVSSRPNDKWKVKPWAWWPEETVEKLAEKLWPTSDAAVRICPDCERRELAMRHRYCEVCRRRRRRNSKLRNRVLKGDS